MLVALLFNVWGTSLFEGDDLEVYQLLDIVHDTDLVRLKERCELLALDKLSEYESNIRVISWSAMMQDFPCMPQDLPDLSEYPSDMMVAWVYTLHTYDIFRDGEEAYKGYEQTYVFAVYELL